MQANVESYMAFPRRLESRTRNASFRPNSLLPERKKKQLHRIKRQISSERDYHTHKQSNKGEEKKNTYRVVCLCATMHINT